MPPLTGIVCARRRPPPRTGLATLTKISTASLLAAAVTLSGCFSGYGEDPAGQEATGLEQEVGALATDLVPTTDSVASQDLAATTASPGSSGVPKVFYLEYADGKTSSRSNPNPCRGPAPKFVCEFAPTLQECQRQVQEYLDRWYSPFNIVFTLTPPPSGPYYTEIVSSGGGAWCDSAANVAGIAPFLCDDLQGGVAYTFLGGKTAKETAIIIAQEQAHLLGLEHTISPRDIMSPTICPDCDGFENVENKTQNDRCNRPTQNSYKMMAARLGAWTGGIKPTPFGCEPDQAAPLVQILTPADQSTVREMFALRVQASDGCKVTRVTVAVTPMGLHAQSATGPFEWVLTKITGRQTVMVTAFDAGGRQSSASVTVNAGGTAASGTGGTAGAGGPGSGGADAGGGSSTEAAGATADAAGCQLAGCEVGTRGGGQAVGVQGRWVSPLVWLGLIGVGLRGRSRRRRSAPLLR